MASFDPKCPYSEQVFMVKDGAGWDNNGFNLSHSLFMVEGFCKNVFGADWREQTDLFPIALYFSRIKNNPTIPDDEEVVYGKIGVLGYIFHISELEAMEEM